MEIEDWKSELIRISPRMETGQTMQLALMVELLEEIRGLRDDLAQGNEPDPDADPDPFQTLNGPRL